MIKFTHNPEYNNFTARICAKVVSLGEVVQENKNGKTYVVGAVEFIDDSNQLVIRQAICPTVNIAKIEIGKTFLCNVTITEERPDEPIISISPLQFTPISSKEDFGFDFKTALKEVKVGSEEVM